MTRAGLSPAAQLLLLRSTMLWWQAVSRGSTCAPASTPNSRTCLKLYCVRGTVCQPHTLVLISWGRASNTVWRPGRVGCGA
eukprot:2429492-Rhodomonas_salina.1